MTTSSWVSFWQVLSLLGIIVAFVSSLGLWRTKTELEDQKNRQIISLEQRVESQRHFNAIVVKAHNDDRAAFDQLLDWAADDISPLAAQAQHAVTSILEGRAVFYQDESNMIWDGPNVSGKPLDQLQLLISSIAPNRRQALLRHVFEAKKLPVGKRLRFFVGVMEKDSSLKTVEFAANFFAITAGLQFEPKVYRYYLRWWKQHETEYREQQ